MSEKPVEDAVAIGPGRIELRAKLDPFNQRFDFLFMQFATCTNGRTLASVSTDIVFRTVVPGEYLKPALVCTQEEAQQMMDELWRCGLRPTEGSGSAGSLAATQRHLEDMRRLVFDRKTAEGGGT